MFSYIDIAFVKGDIALSTTGVEYELLKQGNADCLLVFQLLKQLKVSAIQYAFTVFKGECYILREIDSELELIDSTIRFEYNQKKILNHNDFFLANQFLNQIDSTKNEVSVWVKWGRKTEYFIDVFDKNEEAIAFELWYEHHAMAIKDPIVLQQRFNILLNEPFLNKLKTYIQLWKIKYNITYDLPAWYSQLYNLK